ncbi:hypothetical protein [Arthrobacter bambusae]|nr:hypothetical protein [Arthrobacter bambusae]
METATEGTQIARPSFKQLIAMFYVTSILFAVVVLGSVTPPTRT